MNKPYYDHKYKRWILKLSETSKLEFQSQSKAEDYYEKNKGTN